MTFDKKELEQLENSRAYVVSYMDENGRGPLFVKGKTLDVEMLLGVAFNNLGDVKYKVLKNILYHLFLEDVGKVKIENSLEILITTEKLFKLLEQNTKGETLNETNYS